jgi:hypothetical protein
MVIPRRKIPSSMAVIPLQMEVFYPGLLSGSYQEYLHRKPICLTIKIADSELSPTRSELQGSWLGNNFRLLIVLLSKTVFMDIAWVKIKIEYLLQRNTAK